MSFDKNLEQLDGILRQLESEPLSLDEAFGVFEKGIAIVRETEGMLRDTEQKVTLLSEEGGFDEEPPDDEYDGDDDDIVGAVKKR